MDVPPFELSHDTSDTTWNFFELLHTQKRLPNFVDSFYALFPSLIHHGVLAMGCVGVIALFRFFPRASRPCF